MATVIYPSFLADSFAGEIDLVSDTIKVMLVSSAYTPSLSHSKRSDITNEVTGTGYSAGGQILSGASITTVLANAWTTPWVSSFEYNHGDIVRPTVANGFLYRAVTTGTSSGSQPTWPTTLGSYIVDGTTGWVCSGSAITLLSAFDTNWGNSSITARGAVLYKSRGGAASADNLIAYLGFTDEFGVPEDRTTSNETFSVAMKSFNNFSGFAVIFSV